MKVAFQPENLQFPLAYLEDIVLFSRSAAEPVVHDKYMLTLFSDAEVILKVKMWKLFTETMEH